jgi:hypothetical protein
LLFVLFVCVSLTACAPSLNWRQFQLPSEPVRALFPCKVESHSQDLTLPALEAAASAAPASAPVLNLEPRKGRYTLHHCQAQGLTFALSSLQASDEASAAHALTALQRLLNQQLQGANIRQQAWAQAKPGLVLDSQSVWRIAGQRQGQPFQAQAGFFRVGTVAYQAMVLGAALPAEATDSFFEGVERSP